MLRPLRRPNLEIQPAITLRLGLRCADERVRGRGLQYPLPVGHVLAPASSARAKCRACGRQIQRGELRFGECIPNPYADGEMTLWFHPGCAAYRRPEPFLQALTQTTEPVHDREYLERAASRAVTHPRLVRIDGAELSRSGQAKCRSCHEPIARGEWRIRLAFFEEGRFSPGGYLHLNCRTTYFETDEVLDHVLQFSPQLSEAERETLVLAFNTGSGVPAPSAREDTGTSSIE